MPITPLLSLKRRDGMGNIIKMKWKQKGMSAAERRKYGVEEIPVSEIRERANELGISSATVKELLTPTTNHSQKIIISLSNPSKVKL